MGGSGSWCTVTPLSVMVVVPRPLRCAGSGAGGSALVAEAISRRDTAAADDDKEGVVRVGVAEAADDDATQLTIPQRQLPEPSQSSVSASAGDATATGEAALGEAAVGDTVPELCSECVGLRRLRRSGHSGLDIGEPMEGTEANGLSPWPRLWPREGPWRKKPVLGHGGELSGDRSGDTPPAMLTAGC